MMADYRPQRLRDLTPEQIADKKVRDDLYELAVAALSGHFYEKKRTVGVTTEEEEAYNAAKRQLWAEERQRRIAAGLYEEVDRLEELREARQKLQSELVRVNEDIAEEEGRRGIRP